MLLQKSLPKPKNDPKRRTNRYAAFSIRTGVCDTFHFLAKVSILQFPRKELAFVTTFAIIEENPKIKECILYEY